MKVERFGPLNTPDARPAVPASPTEGTYCRRWALAGLALLTSVACQVTAAEGWNALAEEGRDLYYGSQPFAQAPQVAGAPLLAEHGACVRCHGLAGEGRREAAAAAPDIRSATLKRHGSNVEQVLDAALRQGRDAQGRDLAPAMPRYQLSAQEQAALRAFWPWLGNEAQPVRGVEADVLRLGLVLDGLAPAAGAAPLAEQVATGIGQVFERVNAGGGVHGRRLELVQLSSDAALPHALSLFALVGSAPREPLRGQLGAQRLPSLAALALETVDVGGAAWQLPLLPSLQQQAQAALQRLQEGPASLASSAPCTRWWYDPAKRLDAGLPAGVISTAQPPPLVPGASLCWAALAPAAHVDALRAQLEQRGVRLVQLVELALQRPRPLILPGLEHELVLPLPNAVAQEAARQGLPLWQALGQVAARSAVEALARSGRVLQPEALLVAFRSLTGFEPVAGAPLTLSRTQGHGWRPSIWAGSLGTPPAPAAPDPFLAGRSP